MDRYIILLTALLVFCCTGVISDQSSGNSQANTASRCFSFTWLGPQWHNESIFMNATCNDATRLAKGIPCQQPLVVSYDGSWPDVDYIWAHHREEATCVLAPNDICAQYTYYFNGQVDNSTYMCTRAVDNYDSAVTSGCFKQVNGSFTTEVCFCRPVPGGMPCNKAISSSVLSTSVALFAYALIMNRNFVNGLINIIGQ